MVYVCVIDKILVSKVSIATFRTIFGKSVNSDVMACFYVINKTRVTSYELRVTSYELRVAS